MYNARRIKDRIWRARTLSVFIAQVAILKVFGHNLAQIYTNHEKSLIPLSVRKDILIRPKKNYKISKLQNYKN